MSKRHSLELLAKVSNPSHSFMDLEVDEEGSVPNVPQRIASRLTARPKPRSVLTSDIQTVDESNNSVARLGNFSLIIFLSFYFIISKY